MQMRAAVDVEGDAGEVCAGVVGEEEDAVDDIGHGADAADERRFTQFLLALLGDLPAEDVRVNQ